MRGRPKKQSSTPGGSHSSSTDNKICWQVNVATGAAMLPFRVIPKASRARRLEFCLPLLEAVFRLFGQSAAVNVVELLF